MNTALIADKPAAHPFRAAASGRLAAWLQRVAVTAAAPAPTATDLRPIHTGATLWVNRPLGRVVSCKTGSLWLTFDNEPEDIVLEAGESHRCAKTSPLSIHALADAVVRVA